MPRGVIEEAEQQGRIEARRLPDGSHRAEFSERVYTPELVPFGLDPILLERIPCVAHHLLANLQSEDELRSSLDGSEGPSPIMGSDVDDTLAREG